MPLSTAMRKSKDKERIRDNARTQQTPLWSRLVIERHNAAEQRISTATTTTTTVKFIVSLLFLSSKRCLSQKQLSKFCRSIMISTVMPLENDQQSAVAEASGFGFLHLIFAVHCFIGLLGENCLHKKNHLTNFCVDDDIRLKDDPFRLIWDGDQVKEVEIWSARRNGNWFS